MNRLALKIQMSSERIGSGSMASVPVPIELPAKDQECCKDPGKEEGGKEALVEEIVLALTATANREYPRKRWLYFCETYRYSRRSMSTKTASSRQQKSKTPQSPCSSSIKTAMEFSAPKKCAPTRLKCQCSLLAANRVTSPARN